MHTLFCIVNQFYWNYFASLKLNVYVYNYTSQYVMQFSSVELIKKIKTQFSSGFFLFFLKLLLL